MAGIGFELRKIFKKQSFLNLVRAYGYSAILSVGAWIFAIFAIGITVWYIKYVQGYDVLANQYATSLTYLIAGTLILSGFFQHSFTRFVADQIYAKKSEYICPNLIAVILVSNITIGLIGYLLTYFFVPDQSFFYRLFMAASFNMLCIVWICNNLLSGLKYYNAIMLLFILSYCLSGFLAITFVNLGLSWLIFAFYISQFILVSGMIILLFKQYPTHQLIRWDYFSTKNTFISLVFTSFLANLAFWIDKILFWIFPSTRFAVIGNLFASPLYDAPMFLAILTVIPGLTVFLYRIETDFAYIYDLYFKDIRRGATLQEIRDRHNELVKTGRQCFYDVLRYQGLTVLFVILFAKPILHLLHLSPLYVYLLRIDIISIALLTIFMGLFNLLSYLDRLKELFILSVVFLVLNFLLTLISYYLGVFYYGYGFALALLITDLLALYFLNSAFDKLEYRTFMLA